MYIWIFLVTQNISPLSMKSLLVIQNKKNGNIETQLMGTQTQHTESTYKMKTKRKLKPHTY